MRKFRMLLAMLCVFALMVPFTACGGNDVVEDDPSTDITDVVDEDVDADTDVTDTESEDDDSSITTGASTSGSTTDSESESGNSDESESTLLISGVYDIDLATAANAMMANYMSNYIVVDASEMTFEFYSYMKTSGVYSARDTGTIVEEDGVYTLDYADSEDTASFTATGDVITFTTKLPWNGQSFGVADDDGNISFTATLVVGGTYELDLATAASAMMANYMAEYIVVNAYDMTFTAYKYTVSTAVYSVVFSGTITYDEENDAYVMNYDDGETTATFTFDNATNSIVFADSIPWGTSSFNASSATYCTVVPYVETAEENENTDSSSDDNLTVNDQVGTGSQL